MPRSITALILGSGPDAQFAAELPLHKFDYVIVINNAWRATPNGPILSILMIFQPTECPPKLARLKA